MVRKDHKNNLHPGMLNYLLFCRFFNYSYFNLCIHLLNTSCEQYLVHKNQRFK